MSLHQSIPSAVQAASPPQSRMQDINMGGRTVHEGSHQHQDINQHDLMSDSTDSYPISWRWWAVLTSPIIIFSFSVGVYSYFSAIEAGELIALNSINIVVLSFWAIISYRSYKLPYITLSKNELIIKDFLGGQTRILGWDEIKNVKYSDSKLSIMTNHENSISIPKRILADFHYEALFAQLRNELNRKNSAIYMIGRYGVVTNGLDAYVTYDCFGTFKKISELTSYLKRKKANNSIQRIYICINGTRKRFMFRMTDKNLAYAINEAQQNTPVSVNNELV